MSYVYPPLFFCHIFKQSTCAKLTCLSGISTTKLKDPFGKVDSICLYVPIVDNFQCKKYPYLICLLYWCYAMFILFCPFVKNVPNGHPRKTNICNYITRIDVKAALENSSIIYIPTCKVLIMTEFNTILRRFL